MLTAFDYPVELAPDGDTLLVTSPDFPELTTFGTDEADALRHAADALVAMVAQYMDRHLDIPAPSPPEGRPVVGLPTVVAAKAALYQAMRATRVTQTELAERLGCDPRQVRRLLDPTTSSRFDQLDAALAALGRRLRVTVLEPAPY
jgi:antitoxin HicB